MYYNMDVAIKSYAISFLTGNTFDGFIDCTLEQQKGPARPNSNSSTDQKCVTMLRKRRKSKSFEHVV
jgi:hypothetical protein